MSTASARPDNLAAYRSRLEPVDSTMRCTTGGLYAALRAYQARCAQFGADHTAVATALTRHVSAMEALDGWVGRVGDAFRHADRAVGPVPPGVVLSTDRAVGRAGTDDLAAAVPALPTMTSAQVHEWWARLVPEERAALIAAYPGVIGSTDGIPAAVRDQANRIVLGRRTAALTARLDYLKAHPPAMQVVEQNGALVYNNPDYFHWRDEVSTVSGQLKALNAVNQTLALGGRQLLLLDLDHEAPRAAVAVGDVGTADHVAVFTPGFTSTVAGSLGGYDRDMARLVDVTEDSLSKEGRGTETVAAVTWIGYDVPQWSTTLDVLNPFDHHDESVASPDAARAGGKDLARFLDGITASRDTDPHLTALGHSYGSVTTGYALQQAQTVDDAVFFGSPGLGTSDIHDLHVPDGHIGVIEAYLDPVADLGRFGQDPSQIDGVTNLSADAETSWDGEQLKRSTGHSAYLSPDSSSLYNIAQTVGGMPERRIEGENYDLGDALRQPRTALDLGHLWSAAEHAPREVISTAKGAWHHIPKPW